MPDTFESLWAECSEPSDRDDGERRDLADLFWRSGGAAAREAIRLELMAEVEHLEDRAVKAENAFDDERRDRLLLQRDALHDLARRLEP